MSDSLAISTTARLRSVLKTSREKLHLPRRLYHFSCGVVCFYLYAFVLTRDQAILLLATIGGSFVLLDLLRINHPKVNHLALQIFGKLMRNEEIKSLSANSYYVIGLTIILVLFPKPIVLLSVLFLAAGDPVAAIIGTQFGQTKLFQNKSLEGSLASFTICGLLSFLVLRYYMKLDSSQALLASFFGGCIGAIAEALPFKLNDNLTLPIASALMLSLLQRIYPFLTP